MASHLSEHNNYRSLGLILGSRTRKKKIIMTKDLWIEGRQINIYVLQNKEFYFREPISTASNISISWRMR
jgi:hypothetical protein